MELYHGSNLIISKPDLVHSRSQIDFGKGFYLTDNLEHAKKLAKNKSYRYNRTPVVNHYELNENAFTELSVKIFVTHDGEWLDYVVKNRSGHCTEDYDLVIGDIADDRAFSTILSYIDGDLSKEAAIVQLKPQVFPRQFVFKTEKALSYLTFMNGGDLYVSR